MIHVDDATAYTDDVACYLLPELSGLINQLQLQLELILQSSSISTYSNVYKVQQLNG